MKKFIKIIMFFNLVNILLSYKPIERIDLIVKSYKDTISCGEDYKAKIYIADSSIFNWKSHEPIVEIRKMPMETKDDTAFFSFGTFCIPNATGIKKYSYSGSMIINLKNYKDTTLYFTTDYYVKYK